MKVAVLRHCKLSICEAQRETERHVSAGRRASSSHEKSLFSRRDERHMLRAECDEA